MSAGICEWPDCTNEALCQSGNFGNKLVCSEHFKITNGAQQAQSTQPIREQSAEGRAEIENGNIVIRVAIECLPTIVNGGPHSDTIEITNAEEFARELLRELQSEAENGTTIVHRMFDDAILRAYEKGAEGCRQYNPVISELESEFVE